METDACFPEQNKCLDFCANEAQQVSNKRKIREALLSFMPNDRTEFDYYIKVQKF